MKKKLIIALAAVAVLAAIIGLILAFGNRAPAQTVPAAQTADPTPAPSVKPTQAASPEPTQLTPPVASPVPTDQVEVEEATDADGRTGRRFVIRHADGTVSEFWIYNEEDDDPAPSEEPQPTENPQPTTTPLPSPKPQSSPQPTDDPSAELVQAAAEYEWFMALSPAEQAQYSMSFEPYEAFFEWFNGVKSAYETLHKGIEIGPGDYIVVD